MLDVDTPVGRTENAARQRYLQPGLALSVSDLTDTLGGYVSRLVRVDDRHLWIGLPMRRDGMLTLSEGQLVSVRFDRPGDAVYLFDSVVADRREDDEAPFGIALPVTINRRPRRSSARLALVLDASYEPVAGGPGAAAWIVDVAAGGLGMICEEELAIGDELVVRCALPGEGDGVDLAERASVQTSSLYGRTPGGSTLHHHGLRFTGIDDDVREQILETIIWNLTSRSGSE
ncbi:MAG: flagellar brake protein [Acidimicrobiales bacterium]|nr:flagellar brake protein [Acidimicrobiales bacterium]